jgi:hypothetical protein
MIGWMSVASLHAHRSILARLAAFFYRFHLGHDDLVQLRRESLADNILYTCKRVDKNVRDANLAVNQTTDLETSVLMSVGDVSTEITTYRRLSPGWIKMSTLPPSRNQPCLRK